MTPIDQYIYSKPPEIRDLLDFLNVELLAFDPTIRCELKWRVPYYSRKKLLCYLNVTKANKVELNFSKAFLFTVEIKQYLDFRNRTTIGGIMYSRLEDVNMNKLKLILEEAVRVDSL